jgi:hypothetical protein
VQKQDGNIAGALSRVAVMAALHFDFKLALKDLMNAGDENVHQFAEEDTNKKIFINTLNTLKEIQTKTQVEILKNHKENKNVESFVTQKVAMVQDMNRNMHI